KSTYEPCRWQINAMHFGSKSVRVKTWPAVLFSNLTELENGMWTAEEARKEIRREWNELAASDRQTRDQAAAFPMQIKDKYPFPSKADRSQVIKGWLDLAAFGK